MIKTIIEILVYSIDIYYLYLNLINTMYNIFKRIIKTSVFIDIS